MAMSNSSVLAGRKSLNIAMRGLSIGKSQSAPFKDLPKRPITPWITYYVNNFQDRKKSFPSSPVTVICKDLAQDWKKVPASKKTAMSTGFEKEMVKYKKQMAAVPQEQLDAIANQKKADKLAKEITAAKDDLKDMLNRMKKPKRPLNSYMLYAEEARKNLPASLSPTEKTKRMGSEWEKMSAYQKSTYEKKAADLNANFEKALNKWEKKMEREGKLIQIQFAKFRISEMRKKAASSNPE